MMTHSCPLRHLNIEGTELCPKRAVAQTIRFRNCLQTPSKLGTVTEVPRPAWFFFLQRPHHLIGMEGKRGRRRGGGGD